MKMILYHCISAYHVIQAMVHRKRKHPEDTAILLIADFSADKFADYRELNIFFDEIILFPYREIEHHPDSIIEATAKLYEKCVPYSISEFDELYVAAAHYYFSLYLIANKVYFHFMEDGCGILSKPKVSYDIVMKYAPIQADIAQTYGMFDGKNPYVTDRTCNLGAQSFQVDDTDIVDFDLVVEMKKCGGAYIDKILDFFRIDKIHEDLSDMALVFTQQLANLGIVSFEEQITIYQLVIDFFLPGKRILFKIHPDDVMYYDFIFPESRTLQGRYPAELLPFIADQMAETSLTVFSSSVLSIKNAFLQNIFCGYDFDKTFSRIDSYYFVLDILSGLKIAEYDFYGYGVDISLMENLLQNSLPLRDKICFKYPRHYCGQTKAKSVFVIDDITFKSDVFRNMDSDMSFEYERQEVRFPENSTLDGVEECCKTVQDHFETESTDQEMMKTQTDEIMDARDIRGLLEDLQEGSIVVFVNTQGDYCFYSFEHKYLFEKMIPVKMNRTKIRSENVYYESEPQVVYFYTDDEGAEKMVKEYKGKKVLKNTGICDEIIPMTDDQRRIAVLEGMLKATENRLLYYINKEKEK